MSINFDNLGYDKNEPNLIKMCLKVKDFKMKLTKDL